jgi:hypothetical protein
MTHWVEEACKLRKQRRKQELFNVIYSFSEDIISKYCSGNYSWYQEIVSKKDSKKLSDIGFSDEFGESGQTNGAWWSIYEFTDGEFTFYVQFYANSFSIVEPKGVRISKHYLF